MKTLCEQILALAAKQPEGTPLVASELLHLGARAAIDQSLARLCKRGQLMRAGRGLYLLPVKGRFGVRAPEPGKVIEAFASQSGEVVVPSEAAAANALGLTTQVPVRQVYLTSGKTRQLRLGNQLLELKHAPSWKLVGGNKPAGQAFRALLWAGPENVTQVAGKIKKQLKPAELVSLSKVPKKRMPEWAAREISGMMSNG